MRKIQIKIKENFGRRDVYPIGDLGNEIKKLTGKQTLSKTHIETLKKLGFEFDIQAPSLTE